MGGVGRRSCSWQGECLESARRVQEIPKEDGESGGELDISFKCGFSSILMVVLVRGSYMCHKYVF